MKELPLPEHPFYNEEYPHYASFWQSKPVLLSKVYKENYNLGNIILRLVKDEKAIGTRVPKQGGKHDWIVRMKLPDKK